MAGLSVFGFSVVLLVFWLVIILWGMSLARKIYLMINDAKEGNSGPWYVWEKCRVQVVIWLVALLFVIFYANHELAYRPKTVILNPAQYSIDQRMRQVDQMDAPEIKPAQPLTPMDGDAKKALEENEASNAKTREAFENL